MVAHGETGRGSFPKTCNMCLRTGQPAQDAKMPHNQILPLEPFQKWGLSFMGPFTLAIAQTSNQYILVATNFCTKWVEPKQMHDNTAKSTAKFPERNVVDCPEVFKYHIEQAR